MAPRKTQKKQPAKQPEKQNALNKVAAKVRDMNETCQTWLYHDTVPDGHLFQTVGDVEAAEADGWVDSPAKLKADGDAGT